MKRDFLHFVAKDPHWSLLWWEISKETLDAFKLRQSKDFAGCIKIIRVYDVTHIIFDGANAHRYFDIEIDESNDHWYLNIADSNRDYLAEIGYKTKSSGFIPLVRSNTVHLPRHWPESCTEETWGTVSGSHYAANNVCVGESGPEKGYLMLVLNTHMPYVRNFRTGNTREENWLFEAMTCCYLPLIDMFSRLESDSAEFAFTFSISPPLMEMLGDPLLKERFMQYLDRQSELAEAERRRIRHHPPFCSVAETYYYTLLKWKKLFSWKWNRDLLTVLKGFNDSGKIELITSSASHAFLPIWYIYPHIVNLQVRLGAASFHARFGKEPTGFWLPECGFAPGIDDILAANRFRYFFLESHAINYGYPRPRFDIGAPVLCPSGTAAFGRNWTCHDQVWCKEKGYPGEPAYKDFYLDINRSLELNSSDLTPITPQHTAEINIKYFRQDKKPYDPGAALQSCRRHARHFVDHCRRQVEHFFRQHGKKPVLVLMLDTEHFGHWWHEGPLWLDMVTRELIYEQNIVKLITPTQYLARYPVHQTVVPTMSSWGYQGYGETWLMGRNHWIYREAFKAIDTLDLLMETNKKKGNRYDRFISQYIRELLLIQSSDWAFLLHANKFNRYVENKVETGLDNMKKIADTIMAGGETGNDILTPMLQENNLFSDFILQRYYRGRHHG